MKERNLKFCRFGRPHMFRLWRKNGNLVIDEKTFKCECGVVELHDGTLTTEYQISKNQKKEY